MTLKTALATAALLLACGSAMAQTATQPDATGAMTTRPVKTATVQFITLQPTSAVTSRILGTKVTNAQNESIGDIADLVIVDGKTVLRILEFSVADEKWTGRHWKYLLEPGASAIGDFNMIDATTALVIERDDKEGTADKACSEGKKAADCFDDIAKFKRIVKIEMSDANAGSAARKIGYIDLLKIQDPDKKARKPLNGGVLTFPFFTIENVAVVDGEHIIVGNDNNLPFSAGRHLTRADDNEMILLRVPELLRAR